ncbi:MAG: hypothetical protein ACM3L6_02880 [Deltaproteobacteria bacterium]
MNELWFRRKYLPYLVTGQLRATLREGRRDEHHPKGYRLGEKVLLRCFDLPGEDEFRTNAVVTQLSFFRIGELRPDVLRGGPPDCLTKETAVETLESLYRRPFGEDETVTLLHLDYLKEQ